MQCLDAVVREYAPRLKRYSEFPVPTASALRRCSWHWRRPPSCTTHRVAICFVHRLTLHPHPRAFGVEQRLAEDCCFAPFTEDLDLEHALPQISGQSRRDVSLGK